MLKPPIERSSLINSSGEVPCLGMPRRNGDKDGIGHFDKDTGISWDFHDFIYGISRIYPEDPDFHR